jgi:hypothetical protein
MQIRNVLLKKKQVGGERSNANKQVRGYKEEIRMNVVHNLKPIDRSS